MRCHGVVEEAQGEERETESERARESAGSWTPPPPSPDSSLLPPPPPEMRGAARARRMLDRLRLAPEVEVGPVEYKLQLLQPSAGRLQQLVTQLHYRLAEGGGRATYLLGVGDDGVLCGLRREQMDASLLTLRDMCAQLSARVTERRERIVADSRVVAELCIEQLADASQLEVRLAVLGATQAGKSTIVAVLSGGPSALDDGKGSARTHVMRHLHELEMGATSSVAQKVLGFDSEARLLNWADEFARTPAELCEASTRLLTLLDLCGEERFLRTTLFGLTAHAPCSALLCVGADTGITATTRLHAALAFALDLPVLALISKADLVDEAGLRTVSESVLQLLSEHGFPSPMLLRTEEDLTLAELPLAPQSSLGVPHHEDHAQHMMTQLARDGSGLSCDESAWRCKCGSPRSCSCHKCMRGEPTESLGVATIEMECRAGAASTGASAETPSTGRSATGSCSMSRSPGSNSHEDLLPCEGRSGPSVASTPVLAVSARTGAGLSLLIRLLGRMPVRDWSEHRREPLMMAVDGCHAPAYAQPVLKENDPWASTPIPEQVVDAAQGPQGPVVSGTLLRGCLHANGHEDARAESRDLPRECSAHVLGQSSTMEALHCANGPPSHGELNPNSSKSPSLFIGPDAEGRWMPATVRRIKYKDLTTRSATAGQSATFNLHLEGGFGKVRRGMVLVDASSHPLPIPCWEFEAVVMGVHLPIDLAAGAELVIHCLGVKQAVRLQRPPAACGPDNDPVRSDRMSMANPRRRGRTDRSNHDQVCEPHGMCGGGNTKSLAKSSVKLLTRNMTRRLRFRFVHRAEVLLPGTACILRRGAVGAPADLSLVVGRILAPLKTDPQCIAMPQGALVTEGL